MDLIRPWHGNVEDVTYAVNDALPLSDLLCTLSNSSKEHTHGEGHASCTSQTKHNSGASQTNPHHHLAKEGMPTHPLPHRPNKQPRSTMCSCTSESLFVPG